MEDDEQDDLHHEQHLKEEVVTSEEAAIDVPLQQQQQQFDQSQQSSSVQRPPKVIRIAPNRIKDELARAIQSGSFNKNNTLKLSGYQGKEIKIQIRIKDSDNVIKPVSVSQAQNSTQSPTFVPISSISNAPSPRQPIRIQNVQSQGRFMKVTSASSDVASASSSSTSVSSGASGSSGVGGRRSITISSAALRSAKPGEFTPLMRVEKVQESLPSQFLDEAVEESTVVTTTTSTTTTTSENDDVTSQEVVEEETVAMETELPATVAEQEVVAEPHAFLVTEGEGEGVAMDTETGGGDGAVTASEEVVEEQEEEED